MTVTYFPDDQIFQGLFSVARRHSHEHIVIRDHATGQSASMRRLLSDVGHVKRKFSESLPASVLEDLKNGREVWVLSTLPQGYAFVVGYLAVLALGAGMAFLREHVGGEKLDLSFQRTQACAVFCDGRFIEISKSRETYVNPDGNTTPPNTSIFFDTVSLLDSISTLPISVLDEELRLDQDFIPSADGAGCIFHSSATTGPSKGIVQSRTYVLVHNSLTYTADDLIHIGAAPVYWASGVRPILPTLLNGQCYEFCRTVLTPTWLADRISQPGKYRLWTTPSTYESLVNILIRRFSSANLTSFEEIAENDNQIKYKLEGALQNVVEVISTGIRIRPELHEFCSHIFTSCEMRDMYGSSELGAISTATWAMKKVRNTNFIGTIGDNVQAKVDEDGQLCLKTRTSFRRYLTDPERTAKAFDSEGYVNTTDGGYLIGRDMYFEGRLGYDVFKVNNRKVVANEIEDVLISVPFITESAVFPVSLRNDSNRPSNQAAPAVTAAIVVYKILNDKSAATTDVLNRESMTDQIRDAFMGLADHKRPELLVLTPLPLPKNTAGKIVKEATRIQWFPDGFTGDAEGLVDVWSKSRSGSSSPIQG